MLTFFNNILINCLKLITSTVVFVINKWNVFIEKTILP